MYPFPSMEKTRALAPHSQGKQNSVGCLLEPRPLFAFLAIFTIPVLVRSDLVFGTPEGKPLRPNTITRAWESLAGHAGLKVIRLHDARHTHASIMLKQGIHPKIVQERLGHSSIQMTLDTYSHVTPGLQEAAAARFDEVLTAKCKEAETGKTR